MSKREFTKKIGLRAPVVILLAFMILTLLSHRVFGIAVSNKRKISHKVTLHKRKDLYIRDPFILPDSATKTYYLYKSMSVKLKNGQSRGGVVAYISKDLQAWEGPIPVFHWLPL